jgi:hypothetical protein
MSDYQKKSDELEIKRNEFYNKLRKDIYNFSSTHLKYGMCVETLKHVLKENGFSTIDIYQNVEKTINELKRLSEIIPEIEIIRGGPDGNDHMAAQAIANASEGEYIVIALLASYLYPRIKLKGCHHVAAVVKGKLTDNPHVGQGGVISEKHIFKPASWSFSWNLKNIDGIENKHYMVYIKYGLKENEKNA